MRKHIGMRDFVTLTPVAILTVTTCPDIGSGETISMYTSVACANATDDLNVLYTCSGGAPPGRFEEIPEVPVIVESFTLTLYNAFEEGTGASYAGSYLISDYDFGSATATTPAASRRLSRVLLK